MRAALAKSVAVLTVAALAWYFAPLLKAQAGGADDAVFEGTLEVRYQDFEGSARLRNFLRTQERLLELQLPVDAPVLMSGTRLRVHGRLQDNNTLLLTDSGSMTATALASANTFGAQKTLVILVNFSDKVTQPYTVDSAQTVTFQTVNNYYAENTYHQASLTGAVVGWFTIPMSSTICDDYGSTLASQAKQAATTAGVDLSQYTRYVYAFPQNACTWWGMGTVGGNPSEAWVNGSYALRVVAHELGHNFGDFHSKSLPCYSGTCSAVEYGDDRDVMGRSGVVGHMNAFQKERLGWLNYNVSPPVQIVTDANNYLIEPLETPSSGGVKALKILKSTDSYGRKTWYYVETRTKTGVDNNVASGVVVHSGAESSGDTSYQIDFQPSTSTFDSTLDVGQTFSDSTAGVSITTLTADNTGAFVQIAFGAQPCTRFAPTVTMAPSSTMWVRSGSTFNYTMSVTNNDVGSCSSSSFSVASLLPSGWTAAISPSTLSLPPGASGTAAMGVGIPATANGNATVVSNAVESGSAATGSASGSLIVASSLGVAVSTDKSAYSGGTVTVSASVTGNQASVPGAAVSFQLVSGTKTVSLNATTNSNGVATASYRLKARDPRGTWQVTASATKDYVSGNATTSFVVQ